jgi:hypothetical protein
MKNLRALTLPIILSIGICSNYCVDNRTAFVNTYDSLKEKLPIAKERNFIFSFDSLSKEKIWNWNKSDKLILVDSDFYLKYLSNYPDFHHDKDYQLLYFNCIIDFHDSLKHLVVSQKITDYVSNMYLVNFTRKGEILNINLLAKIFLSPDDVILIKSELINRDSLKTTEIHVAKEDDTFTKDSIISMFKYEKGNFNKVNVDTIKISNFKW